MTKALLRRSIPLFALLVLLTPGADGLAAGPPWTTERLIDALAGPSDEDYPFGPVTAGEGFVLLGHDDANGVRSGRAKHTARAEAMRELVRRGPRAVPQLIAHLGDTRRTPLVVRGAGFLETLLFDAQPDRNPRTQRPPLEGVETEYRSVKHHAVTVGDLCYVTLGQIVNRRYVVGGFVGHGKVGFVKAGSTTASSSFRKQVVADWDGLTEWEHAATLINDLLKPDSDQRRIDAAQRLAFYYPHHLEPLALALLARPTYPAAAVERFVRDTLYKTPDRGRCRELLAAFVKHHGEVAREGVERQLRDDWELRDVDEDAASRSPLDLLVELFGRDRHDILADVPHYTEALSDGDLAHFIKAGLVFDGSVKVDAAVLSLLRRAGEDDDLALACMVQLIGRGHDAEIERHCETRLKSVRSDKLKREYMAVLTKRGYTALHVTVERRIPWRVSQLLAEGESPAAVAWNGSTPLHLAVIADHPPILQELARTRRGLEVKDRKGRTPVELALAENDDHAVRTLAAAGCAIDDLLVAVLADRPERAAELLRERPALIRRKTSNDRTAFDLAAKWGHGRTLAVLLRYRAEFDVPHDWLSTPLGLAAANGHVEAARMLLAHKANPRASHYHEEPIHAAVKGGHRAVVELLLAHGADVNAGDRAATPLHLAVGEGDHEMAAYLLKAGARVDVRDYDGATPLHLAVKAGKSDLVRLLLRGKADVRTKGGKDELLLLHVAAIQGSDAVAALLLRAGAEVNAVAGKQGRTALHEAVAAGNVAVVRLLLGSKASVNARTRDNRDTPLHLAAREGRADLVAMLLGAGATPGLINAQGLEPLHEACRDGDAPEAALILLKRGADPNARDREAQTPLHLAAAGGDRGLVAALLDRGAKLEAVNRRGETPLHAAIHVRFLEVTRQIGDKVERTGARWIEPSVPHMVSYLVERGANVNARARDGQTPLHRAAWANDLNIVRLLLSRKADLRARDKEDSTPLDVAVASKNAAVGELLRRFTPVR